MTRRLRPLILLLAFGGLLVAGWAVLSTEVASPTAEQATPTSWTATFADRLSTTFADAPGSLFEGLAGAACFVADAVDPKHAWFPGCEV